MGVKILAVSSIFWLGAEQMVLRFFWVGDTTQNMEMT